MICFFQANAIGAAVSVENLIREAEDAFWFSMEEGGNPEALRTGLQLLSDAEIELSLHPDASLEDRLNALKLDLEKQLELSYDTLFGVFPVVRFATDSVWTNSSSLGTFEIIDDPKVMAVSSAVDRIRELMSKTIEIHGQLDVFFLSSPKDHDLENEALYLFNKDPNFFVHNRMDMISVVGVEQMDSLYESNSGNLDSFFQKNAEKLRAYFRNSHALVVNLRQSGDARSKNKFYVVSAETWSLENINESMGKRVGSYKCFGFSRDRNHLFWPVLFTNLTVIFLLIFLLVYFHRGYIKKFAPVIALLFVVGRTWPSVLGSVMSGFAPAGEELWFVSFWYPLLFFVLAVILPMTLVKMITVKFSSSWMSRQILNNLMCTFALFLGLWLSLGTDLLLWSSVSFPLNPDQIVKLLVLGLALFLLLFVQAEFAFGQSKMPAYWPFAFFLALILMGWGYFSNHSIPMLSSAGLLLPLAYLRTGLPSKMKKDMLSNSDLSEQDESAQGYSVTGEPEDKVEAGGLGQSQFVIFEEYRNFFNPTKFWGKQILISGGEGSGKSRFCRWMVNKMLQKDSSLLVLRGSCDTSIEEGGVAKALGLFASVLENEQISGSEKSDVSELADLVGEVTERLPMISIFKNLVTSAIDATGMISSDSSFEKEFKEWLLLLHRRRRKKLLLVLEDVHWMDEGSKDLLQDLLCWREKKTESDWLTILVTSREKDGFWIKLKEPLSLNLDQCFNSKNQELIASNYDLSRPQVMELISLFDKIKNGNWTWYLQILSSIENCTSESGIDFKELADFDDFMEKQINQYPQHHQVLRACCILGNDFRASELSRVMQKPMIETLALLEEIENQTGWILDEFEQDDIFHIPSLIRNKLIKFFRINYERRKGKSTPQVVREIHAQVARTIENTDSSQRTNELTASRIEEIADHYTFSGNSQRAKAFEWNLQAASLCLATFQFDAAHERLKMAEEYAEGSDDLLKLSKVRISVLDRECSVLSDLETSKDRLKVCEEFLAHNDDLDIEVITLRARHELAMEDAEDAERKKELWEGNLNECERLLAELPKGRKSLLQRLEIIQFIALSQENLRKLDKSSGLSKQDREKILSLYMEALEELKGETDSESLGLTSRIQDSLARFHFEDSEDPGKSLTAARLYFEQSIATKRELDDKLGLAIGLSGLSEVYFKEEEDKEAKKQGLKLLAEAVEFNLEIGSNEHAARGLLEMAKRQEPEEAKESIARIREILGSWEYKGSEDVEGIRKKADDIEESLTH